MRGTLRWVRADLRASRPQALLTVGVIAGVVAALVLATMLLEGTVNPWRGLFARTNGADVLVYLQNGTQVGSLRTLPGYEAMGAPYQSASATLEQGAVKSPVALDAMSTQPPSMSRPLVISGMWLKSADQDGVVVESSFARARRIADGDRITVNGIDGTSVQLRVIGIAETADQGFYPDWTPGLLWVLPTALSQVEPRPSETQEVVGLRIRDASTLGSGQFVQEIDTLYDNSLSSPVLRVTTSQQVMQSMASNDRLLGLLLALFGIIALVAAPCVIANVTAARVLTQRGDLAMLKALGFTPGQVVRMLLAEQTLLGVAGTGLGLAAALSWPLSWPLAWAPLPGSWIALIAVGTVLTVAVATALPAWRAGLVSPVAAVQASPPRGHLSLLARLGLLVHLPAALVLGARDSLTRRLPAALTVAGVAIPMVMITIALSCWSAIDAFSRDPGRIGLAGALSVSQGGLSAPAMKSMIAADSDVLAAYPGASFDTLLPSGTTTFIARALGTTEQPYPFAPVQGSRITAAGEALAGQGFLDLLHLKVGQWTEVTINGELVEVHIVGRTLEPSDNGDVLDFGLDTLSGACDCSYQPQFYSLVLRPGVSPATAQQDLLRASDNQLDVQIVSNPADGLGVVLVVIAVSVAVLAIIGLANLLTSTTVGLRDHRHEVGVLAALGLTPRQVVATLVVNTTILAGLGVGAGVCAGLLLAPRLINMQGRASGMGAGIATAPSLLMVVALAGAALLLATAAALLLARRTMRRSDPAAQLRSPARRAVRPLVP